MSVDGKENWLENLESNFPNFLSELTKQEHTYQAVIEGNTIEGNKEPKTCLCNFGFLLNDKK